MKKLNQYIIEKFKISKSNIKTELYSVGDRCLAINFYSKTISKSIMNNSYDDALCFIDVLEVVEKDNQKDNSNISYKFLTNFAHTTKNIVKTNETIKEEDKSKSKYFFYTILDIACEFILDEETSLEIIDNLIKEQEIDFFEVLGYTPSNFYSYKNKKFKFGIANKESHGEPRIMNDNDWKNIKTTLENGKS